MLQTYVRPSRDLRNNYAEIARLVRENNQVIITNQGRGESVLISMEEYARYEEYLHTRYVEQMLAEAEQQAKDPDTQWVGHEELWNRLREKYEV